MGAHYFTIFAPSISATVGAYLPTKEILLFIKACNNWLESGLEMHKILLLNMQTFLNQNLHLELRM